MALNYTPINSSSYSSQQSPVVNRSVAPIVYGPPAPNRSVAPTMAPTQYFSPSGANMTSASTGLPVQGSIGSPQGANTSNNPSPNLNPPSPQGGGGIPTPDNYMNNFNPGQLNNDQINGLIDQGYNEQMGQLGQTEQALRNQQPGLLQEAQSNYNTNMGIVNSAQQQGYGTLDAQGQQATNTKEDALASARRLYNQLRIGYQQRFGGASSAGQAANEISAAEQQRQQGGVQRDYGTTLQGLSQARQKIDSDHSNTLLQLEQTKQASINTATREFQQKLLDISSNRVAVGQAKSTAQISALQDLRNKVFAINSQAAQFQQQLALQKAQSTSAINTQASSLAQLLQNSGNLTNAYNPQISSGLQINPGVNQSTPDMVGQIYPIASVANGKTRYSDGSIR